jgi:DMSO reductase anchor subunit
MCYERVVAGEPPACVQACPSEAISIQIVSQQEIADACEAPQKRLLPGAFPSDYTLPTTSYVSRKPFPANCEPADANTLNLESPHWPLVWMLVLTQAAAGVFGAAWLAALNVPAYEAVVRILSFVGCLLLFSGLAASVFHLGRPLRAWRAFLGWRKSWMSREIIAFGIWAALALGLLLFGRGRALALLAGAVAGIGFLAVVCSAMIYVDTRRAAWNVGAVFVRFVGTAFLLGASITAGCLAWAAALGRLEFAEAGRSAAILATVIRIALLAWEASGLRRALNLPNDPRTRFARILSHRLPGLIQARAALFFIATFFGLSGVGLSGVLGAVCATISLLLTLAAQLAERYCFFVAAGKPGMPGGVPD